MPYFRKKKLLLIRITFCIFIFLLSAIFSGQIVKAGFEDEYHSYLNVYDDYRVKLTSYISSRNQYLTYGTLTSKNEALTSVQNFLMARDIVLLSYFQLLRTKNVDISYLPIFDEFQTFITAHKSKLTALGSLEDAVAVSHEIENRHLEMQSNARKIVGLLLISKIDNYRNQFNLQSNEAMTLLNILKNDGKEVATLERWLLEAKNKELLGEQKLQRARTLISQFEIYDIDDLTQKFNEVQFTIFEANQYLKEALNYLHEFTETLKYGNY